MRCANRVKFKRDELGNVIIRKGKPVIDRRASIFSFEYESVHGGKFPDTHSVCDGELKTSIGVDADEGTDIQYASGQVTVKCDRCGAEWHPELPTEPKDWEALLDRLIDDIPPWRAEQMRTLYSQKRLEEAERQAQSILLPTRKKRKP